MAEKDNIRDMTPSAKDLAEAVKMGEFRLTFEKASNAPIYMPPDPGWCSNLPGTIAKQLQARKGNVEQLLADYAALLVRAKILTDYLRENVGPTEDWPIMIVAESASADDSTHKLMSELGTVVDFMTEGL